MKKFLAFVLFLLAMLLLAAAYLMVYKPETAGGKWVRGAYARYVAPYWPSQGGAAGDDRAGAPVTAPEVAPVAAPAERAAEGAAKPVPAVSERANLPPKETPPGVRKPKPFSKENYYAGKRLTAADIRGKVVLVYVWDAEAPRSVAILSRMQEVWESFRHKPFTVIGSHRGARSPEVARLLKAKKVTFGVYQEAFLPGEPKIPAERPYFYVMDGEGRLVHRGNSDVTAIEAVVNAISNAMGK